MKPTDPFARDYIACALWASTDENDEPLDGLYSVDDIAPTALASMLEDCEDFFAANEDDIGEHHEQAGHDFWLTRNRHGAGFWDCGNLYGDSGQAQRLTEAAHAYGSSDLYVGDDEFIYVS